MFLSERVQLKTQNKKDNIATPLGPIFKKLFHFSLQNQHFYLQIIQ